MSDDLSSTDWPPPITLTKLDAARRQLRTALDLWFADGDPVSIHTLAFAAYEIIHVISKKHRPRGLIFDSDVIKDEYRAEWNILMKAASNFFKHANRDADKTFEFHPSLSDLFIMFSLQGLSYCGDEMNEAYSAFMYWIGLHHPNFFVKEMRERLANLYTVDDLEKIRSLPKRQFLQAFIEGFARGRREGRGP